MIRKSIVCSPFLDVANNLLPSLLLSTSKPTTMPFTAH